MAARARRPRSHLKLRVAANGHLLCVGACRSQSTGIDLFGANKGKHESSGEDAAHVLKAHEDSINESLLNSAYCTHSLWNK